MKEKLTNAIERWIDHGGGPRLDSKIQQFIARHTYAVKPKVKRLFRGTYVNKDTIEKGQKMYLTRTLQSWTTNYFTARVFASGGKPPNARDSKKWRKKVPIIFVTRKISPEVRGINVENVVEGDPTPEIVLNRPIYVAFYREAYLRNNIIHVPVEIYNSSKKEIQREV